MIKRNQETILWFKDISNNDVALVGGKNASLGEMYTQLTSKGVNVPNGFAITTKCYRDFVQGSGLHTIIEEELNGLNTHNVKSLQKAGARIRGAFLRVEIPDHIRREIENAYRELARIYKTKNLDVAVRSSATAEDLPGASFAGEHETFLNVRGEGYVVKAVRKAFASLFTDRAISYRVDKNFNHFDVELSVTVQKMVRSDKGSSGVMFTLDTETGFRDVVQVEGVWGIGEMIVGGRITPDEFVVFKPTLKKDFAPIIKKTLGVKDKKMVYTSNQKKPLRVISTSRREKLLFSVSDKDVLTLARWAVIIEEHYTKRFKRYTPMDIEWAKDGISGKLYIVQARPETVQVEKRNLEKTVCILNKKGKVLTEGISIGSKIVVGRARVIQSTKNLHEFKKGEILVTKITDPDWEPVMKKAAGIITEKGGRTSHAAIVSRELGIPAVVGTEDALKHIKTGDVVTMDSATSTTGCIYKGALPYTTKVHNLANPPKIKTKLMLNVGTPDGAFLHARLPHKGVGLAREEFIIASHIGIHPLALLNFKKLKDKKLKALIEKKTVGFPDKKDFFISKLAEGVAQIGAAFYPEKVIVRFSDFKTNEYRALVGGELHEPEEENPMLGWRGASRYTHPSFTRAFLMECEAIKHVREKFGLKNVQVMVPFCRTPEEGRGVLSLMKKAGLVKGAEKDGLKVYVMCELPTNVIRADDFLDVFDGFSIGSNDLTQLTLGMDRDSEIIAGISDENDPAVRALVASAIRAAKRRKKYIGFCGQAPSDHPDFLRFLIQEGIDSVSLTPDSIVDMTKEVAREERRQSNTSRKKKK